MFRPEKCTNTSSPPSSFPAIRSADGAGPVGAAAARAGPGARAAAAAHVAARRKRIFGRLHRGAAQRRAELPGADRGDRRRRPAGRHAGKRGINYGITFDRNCGTPQRGQVHAVQQDHRPAAVHRGGHPRRHP